MEDLFSAPCKIVVMGVGGGGCNAINAMIGGGVKNVRFIGVNTDTQALASCRAPVKIQIGKELTHGLGSGALPDTGKRSAIESKDELIAAIEGANMLFIAAGMGGGTGTGAAPVIAELARERHILTVAVVTLPFQFEGLKRKKNADDGVENLRSVVDALVVIPNQKLLYLPETNGLSVIEAFKLADDVLLNSIKGVSDVITNCSNINLDFADVRNVLEHSGSVHIGIGKSKVNTASSSDNDITNLIMKTVKSAIDNQLIDMNIQNASDVILNIMAGRWFKMHEVENICTYIRNVASRPDLNLLFGLNIAPENDESITIIIIAANFVNDEELPNTTQDQQTVTYNRSSILQQPVNTSKEQPIATENKVNKNDKDYYDDDDTNVTVDDTVSKVPAFLRRFSKKKKI